MAPAARQAAVQNARILIQAAACLGLPILATEQYPKGLGRTVAELTEVLPSGTPRLEKTCFSCAGAEPFSTALGASGRSQVILAGMEAHVCVLESALELRAAGREVFVVEDACCSGSARTGLTRCAGCGPPVSWSPIPSLFCLSGSATPGTSTSRRFRRSCGRNEAPVRVEEPVSGGWHSGTATSSLGTRAAAYSPRLIA